MAPGRWEDLELRRILGVGTFGRVKLVLHKPTNTAYALKCMRKQQVVATKQQSHVLNEKRILASMDHPFVLRLMATYQDEGELYMLLELGLGATSPDRPRAPPISALHAPRARGLGGRRPPRPAPAPDSAPAAAVRAGARTAPARSPGTRSSSIALARSRPISPDLARSRRSSSATR